MGVTFNHRLTDAAEFRRAAEDVAAAVQFVRGAAAKFYADPIFTRRLFLAPLLRQPPPHVAALVSYYAILDLRGSRDAKGTPMADDLARRFSAVEALESGAEPFPPVLIARAGQDGPNINAFVEAFTRAAWPKGVLLDVLNHPNGHHWGGFRRPGRRGPQPRGDPPGPSTSSRPGGRAVAGSSEATVVAESGQSPSM